MAKFDMLQKNRQKNRFINLKNDGVLRIMTFRGQSAAVRRGSSSRRERRSSTWPQARVMMRQEDLGRGPIADASLGHSHNPESSAWCKVRAALSHTALLTCSGQLGQVMQEGGKNEGRDRWVATDPGEEKTAEGVFTVLTTEGGVIRTSKLSRWGQGEGGAPPQTLQHGMRRAG